MEGDSWSPEGAYRKGGVATPTSGASFYTQQEYLDLLAGNVCSRLGPTNQGSGMGGSGSGAGELQRHLLPPKRHDLPSELVKNIASIDALIDGALGI
jgi:hypothetical protein